jgi:FkbM family methyltransferase
VRERVIYDFGANIGLNLPYYLKKADKVVAVEANEALAEKLRSRFAPDVQHERLVVVSQAVTTRFRSKNDIPFYIYAGADPFGHVLSSVEQPTEDLTQNFRRTIVSSTDAHQLFAEYGDPFFVKIDIEHHDATVLRDVISWTTPPIYLSVEAHDLDVLAILLLDRRYTGFQIVKGKSVASEFANHPVRIGTVITPMSFPKHSAGPFGEDLLGPWLNRMGLLRKFALVGPGWLDIHASQVESGVEQPTVSRPAPPGVLAPAIEGARLALLAWRRLPRAVKRRFKRDSATPDSTGDRPR